MPGLKLIALKPVMVVGTTTLVLPTTKRGIGVGAGVGGVGAGVGGVGAGVGGAGVGGAGVGAVVVKASSVSSCSAAPASELATGVAPDRPESTLPSTAATSANTASSSIVLRRCETAPLPALASADARDASSSPVGTTFAPPR